MRRERQVHEGIVQGASLSHGPPKGADGAKGVAKQDTRARETRVKRDATAGSPPAA